MLTILAAGGGGSFLGIISGYYGGAIDSVIMRAADIFFALPSILLALVFAITLGPSLQNVVIVIVLTLWATFARQIRGEVLSIREREFVAMARVAGASDLRIMIKHILPNIANTIVVLATLLVGVVILLESTLSFLGVGVPPPAPTWGLMISDGRRWISEAWWVSTLPGIAILLTIVSFNLLGDWLRDYLDPRLRQLV
jgi:peptide/nickel transport system permease protein